ncbi:MAG: IS5 family transposase [Lachnospiraceae bacterium]|nr:IS5 family transposase [Lachnospiraceae bacterium]
MKQQTFSDIEYTNRKKETNREEFLDSMYEIIPCEYWSNLIEEYYPSGKRGRPSKGIETMLDMYLMQNWFNLPDTAIEDAIYDSYAMRSFIHIDFLSEQVPDATTLLKFRQLLEQHKIGEQIFADVTGRLERASLIMHGRTIVDATIITTPNSTKDKENKRNEEMHQTQKENKWYFGMKVHFVADARCGYVHTITGISANVQGVSEAGNLIRRNDEVVYGDSGYLNISEHLDYMDGEQIAKIDFVINVRPSSVKMSKSYKGIRWDENIENRKSSSRCKVEHPFLIVKRQFGYDKTAYKGIAKNMNRFNVLFACANLLICIRAGQTKQFCMA